MRTKNHKIDLKFWLKNGLAMDADKTKAIRFFKKNKTHPIKTLKIKITEVHNVALNRYFAILLEKNLGCEQQAEWKTMKTSCCLFYRLRIYSSKSQLVTVY